MEWCVTGFNSKTRAIMRPKMLIHAMRRSALLLFPAIMLLVSNVHAQVPLAPPPRDRALPYTRSARFASQIGRDDLKDAAVPALGVDWFMQSPFHQAYDGKLVQRTRLGASRGEWVVIR